MLTDSWNGQTRTWRHLKSVLTTSRVDAFAHYLRSATATAKDGLGVWGSWGPLVCSVIPGFLGLKKIIKCLLMWVICKLSYWRLFIKYYFALVHKRWMLFWLFLCRIELNISDFFCFIVDQQMLIEKSSKCSCWTYKNVKICSKNEVAMNWHVTHSLNIIGHYNPALSALYG